MYGSVCGVDVERSVGSGWRWAGALARRAMGTAVDAVQGMLHGVAAGWKRRPEEAEMAASDEQRPAKMNRTGDG